MFDLYYSRLLHFKKLPAKSATLDQIVRSTDMVVTDNASKDSFWSFPGQLDIGDMEKVQNNKIRLIRYTTSDNTEHGYIKEFEVVLKSEDKSQFFNITPNQRIFEFELAGQKVA